MEDTVGSLPLASDPPNLNSETERISGIVYQERKRELDDIALMLRL